MPTELINLLIQLPVVAVFIWYSERIINKFMDFLRTQRETDRDILGKLVTQVEHIGEQLEEHDQMTREGIATMKERTAAREATTKPQRRPATK